jgi:hypothetical protein
MTTSSRDIDITNDEEYEEKRVWKSPSEIFNIKKIYTIISTCLLFLNIVFPAFIGYWHILHFEQFDQYVESDPCVLFLDNNRVPIINIVLLLHLILFSYVEVSAFKHLYQSKGIILIVTYTAISAFYLFTIRYFDQIFINPTQSMWARLIFADTFFVFHFSYMCYDFVTKICLFSLKKTIKIKKK